MRKSHFVLLVGALAVWSVDAPAQTRRFEPNLPPGPMQPSGPIDVPRPFIPSRPSPGPTCGSSCGTQCASVSCSGLNVSQCLSQRQNCRVTCRSQC